MNKLSMIAAIAVVGLGALTAAPSFAATIGTCEDELGTTLGNGVPSAIDSDISAIAAGLKEKGISASNISDYSGCVRADVKRKDGSVALEFFDPNTLQRLSVNG